MKKVYVMKYFTYIAIAFCSIFAEQILNAQESTHGIGLMVGEPAGLTAKVWTSYTTAFDFGFGFSVGGDRIGKYDKYNGGESRLHVHMDYLWHSFDAIQMSERYPVYYGFGLRLNNGAGYDVSMALRGVFGVSWMPVSAPIDFFMELVPMYQFTNSNGFGIDAGVGARYYF